MEEPFILPFIVPSISIRNWGAVCFFSFFFFFGGVFHFSLTGHAGVRGNACIEKIASCTRGHD
jgi:hypothetical protein